MLWAIAGAAIPVAAATPTAPTPAVLMNFLRCIQFPPAVSGNTPCPRERPETGTGHALWKQPVHETAQKTPPERGFRDDVGHATRSDLSGRRLPGHVVVEGVL